MEHGFPIDSVHRKKGSLRADELRPGYAVYKKGQIEGGRIAQQKMIDKGAVAMDWGLSSYLKGQDAQTQLSYCCGQNEQQMGAANVAKRRRKYFELLDSGEWEMNWVPFRFKQYDESLYELLCAAEAEHQLNKANKNANDQSAAARGNKQLVQIYRGLRKSLLADRCAAYTSGKYTPPQLEVTSGGQRRAQLRDDQCV